MDPNDTDVSTLTFKTGTKEGWSIKVAKVMLAAFVYLAVVILTLFVISASTGETLNFSNHYKEDKTILLPISGTTGSEVFSVERYYAEAESAAKIEVLEAKFLVPPN